MKKTKIYCPDTSFLISLLEEDDNNHEKAITEFKNIKIGELFIPNTVAQEFIAKSSKNIREIISVVIQEIEKSSPANLTLNQINTFINQARKGFLKGSAPRIAKDIEKVHRYVKRIYNSPSCINNNINKKSVSSYLYLFKEDINFEYISKFDVLRVIGFKNLSTTPKAEEHVRRNLAYNNFKDLNDGIIINEILRYALSNNEFNFYFLLFDKEFARQAKRHGRQLKCGNLVVKLIT